jgi:hypothetical protein
VIADRVEVQIDRALMAASIVCPETDCGHYCRCTGYVPGEMAIFECRFCATRYYVGLGAQPVLRHERVA